MATFFRNFTRFASTIAARPITAKALVAGASAASAFVVYQSVLAKPAFAEEKSESMRDRLIKNYESRIRDWSSPEKVFMTFASVQNGNEYFMTPEDFAQSLIPSSAPSYSSVAKSGSVIPTNSAPAPASAPAPSGGKKSGKSKKTQSFFELVDLDGNGLISFSEYMFFVTLLSIPLRDMEVAFKMFDLDGNGTLDQAEFAKVIRTIRSESPFAAMQRKQTTDPEVMQVLFGADGKKNLSFGEFRDFVQSLQQEVFKLEFGTYDRENSGTMTPSNFAKTVLSHVDRDQAAVYTPQLKEISGMQGSITLPEFFAFNEMLKNLGAMEVAVRTYASANGSMSKGDLARAARAVAGVQLSPLQVDVIFSLFDRNKDSTLDPNEFIRVLRSRNDLGLKRNRDTGVTRVLDCCVRCVTSHHDE